MFSSANGAILFMRIITEFSFDPKGTNQGFWSPWVGNHGFPWLKVNEQYRFYVHLCFLMRRMPQLSLVSEKGLWVPNRMRINVKHLPGLHGLVHGIVQCLHGYDSSKMLHNDKEKKKPHHAFPLQQIENKFLILKSLGHGSCHWVFSKRYVLFQMTVTLGCWGQPMLPGYWSSQKLAGEVKAQIGRPDVGRAWYNFWALTLAYQTC